MKTNTPFCANLVRLGPHRSRPMHDLDFELQLTSTYTCDRSCKPVGPDNLDVSPELCIPGRSCFEQD
ncbi:hypothetical protein GF406_01290 [candidate division KSB1 bacterium]|nr:hypothetical protein [candidate division KSB1 bacterium]